jgi:hypothetical protein
LRERNLPAVKVVPQQLGWVARAGRQATAKSAAGGTSDSESGGVFKTFWAIRDTYGLKIEPAVPDRTALLLLGVVMVIHAIQEKREHRSRG